MGDVINIGVSSLDEVDARLDAAFRSEAQGSRISFLSYKEMVETLSPKRYEIVLALTGAGPLSIREIARRVGRDVKGVHSDVTRLVKAGVINRTDTGKIEFPYDAIHVDFMLHKAA
jgi:predicted transcriptional regulator